MQTWQLQVAKSRLSELVRMVADQGPQAISVRGKQEAIILSKLDYEQLIGKKESLVEFMQQSPLRGLNLELDRNRTKTRNIQTFP